MKKYAAMMLFSCCLVASCNNRRDKALGRVDHELWLDYQVWGEESKENVTVMLQFRTANSKKNTLLLEDRAGVELDGQALKADSSKMTGIYYEVEKPLHAFEGHHSLVFTDFEGKEYEEKFRFTAFRLQGAFPDTIHRSDFLLQLEGLEKEDYIRIIALDTAFRSNGLNDVDTVRGGKLVLTADRLKNLVNGPVKIDLYKEVERPLNNSWPGGGRLSISYGLKREFELAD